MMTALRTFKQKVLPNKSALATNEVHIREGQQACDRKILIFCFGEVLPFHQC